MNSILYYILYAYLYLHALLPFRVLYVLSDVLYVGVYYLIGYRRSVVRSNLRASFPDKSEEQIKQIEIKFYHHFCDYIVETIKLLHISDKQMQSRLVFENVDLLRHQIQHNTSCIIYMGHYGNWEWVTSLNLLFDDNTTLGQIYRPLKSKVVDRLFLKIRSRFKSLSIAKNNTLRTILGFKRDKQQVVIGFISDQTPSPHNIHYWTTFLNQQTGVFTGVERIAKQTGFGVSYLDVTKTSRGHYRCELKLISNDPASEPQYALTEKYIRALETSIMRDPAYWLWTHKRWKYRKSDIENL